MEFRPGDWVRFYKNGLLVIGEVRYVNPDEVRTWMTYLDTDCGRIEMSSVLEMRPSTKGE